MKQETFEDAPSNTWCAIFTLAIMFVPPILEWMVDTFADYITR